MQITSSNLYIMATGALCAVLAGCAHPAYDQMAAEADARAPNLHISCNDKTDCPAKWARATQWVSDNSYYKIRLATDSLITTEGPTSDPMSAMRSAIAVNKVPLGNGTSQITFKSWCANEFGCVPNHNMLLVSFADFVTAVPQVQK